MNGKNRGNRPQYTANVFDEFGGFDSRIWIEEITKLVDNDEPIVLICHAGVRSKWVAN